MIWKKIKKMFGADYDDIITDREVYHKSYPEIAEKYGKSISEIQKIWHAHLGVSVKNLNQKELGLLMKKNSWLEGLETRVGINLVDAGFKGVTELQRFINNDPDQLLKLDRIGKKSVAKIMSWMGKGGGDND